MHLNYKNLKEISLDKKCLVFDHHLKSLSHFSLPTPIKISNNSIRVFYGKRNIENKTSIFSFDFNYELFSIKKIKKKPLIKFGPIGSFYQDGIYPSSIVKIKNNYCLYFIGYERHYKNIFRTSIGLAKSSNLVNFQIYNFPLIDRNKYDNFFVTSPFVSDENLNKIFYTSGIKMYEGKPFYKCLIKTADIKNINEIIPNKKIFLNNNFILTRFTYAKYENCIIGAYSFDKGHGYEIEISIFDLNFNLKKKLFFPELEGLHLSYPYIYKLDKKSFCLFFNNGQTDKNGIMIYKGNIKYL